LGGGSWAAFTAALRVLTGGRGHDGNVVIRLGGKPGDLLKAYASIDVAGIYEHPWAMPYETGRRILWICRGRKPPFETAWPRFKHYD
jgi:hypothetical protein